MISVPSQPGDAKASPLSPTKVLLSWEPPSFTNAAVTGYVIAYNGSGDEANSREVNVDVPIKQFTIDSLLPDTEYTFRIAAKSANGIGAFSHPVTIRTSPSGKRLIKKTIVIGHPYIPRILRR